MKKILVILVLLLCSKCLFCQKYKSDSIFYYLTGGNAVYWEKASVACNGKTKFGYCFSKNATWFDYNIDCNNNKVFDNVDGRRGSAFPIWNFVIKNDTVYLYKTNHLGSLGGTKLKIVSITKDELLIQVYYERVAGDNTSRPEPAILTLKKADNQTELPKEPHLIYPNDRDKWWVGDDSCCHNFFRLPTNTD